jgi:hypothetical protein
VNAQTVEALIELIGLEAQIAAREAVHQSPTKDMYLRRDELQRELREASHA